MTWNFDPQANTPTPMGFHACHSKLPKLKKLKGLLVLQFSTNTNWNRYHLLPNN